MANYEGVIILAAIFGLIPGAIAQSKGHSFLLWWIFGTLLWIVAMPCALMLSRTGEKKCPACAEFVKNDAKVCRYCTNVLPATPRDLTKAIPGEQCNARATGELHAWSMADGIYCCFCKMERQE